MVVSSRSDAPVAGEAVRRVASLRPALDERALEAETLRHMPDATVDDLANVGLITLMAPRVYGGDEADLDVLVAATIEVGKSCGSTAWTLCIYGIHNWLAGKFRSTTGSRRRCSRRRPRCCSPGVGRRTVSPSRSTAATG